MDLYYNINMLAPLVKGKRKSTMYLYFLFFFNILSFVLTYPWMHTTFTDLLIGKIMGSLRLNVYFVLIKTFHFSMEASLHLATTFSHLTKLGYKIHQFQGYS